MTFQAIRSYPLEANGGFGLPHLVQEREGTWTVMVTPPTTARQTKTKGLLLDSVSR